MADSDDAQPPVYAIRFAVSAMLMLEQEHERLQAFNGEAVADEWQNGLLVFIRTLATYPQRCAVAPEDVLFADATVRQLLYRRRRGGSVWRILLTIHEADEHDPPTVRIHHIRHGAQARMTEWPEEEP